MTDTAMRQDLPRFHEYMNKARAALAAGDYQSGASYAELAAEFTNFPGRAEARALWAECENARRVSWGLRFVPVPEAAGREFFARCKKCGSVIPAGYKWADRFGPAHDSYYDFGCIPENFR